MLFERAFYEGLAQQIAEAIESGLPQLQVTRSSVEIEFISYSDMEISYAKLLQIASILGTTEFDVKFRKEDGYAISELTWQPGTTYFGISFAPEKAVKAQNV